MDKKRVLQVALVIVVLILLYQVLDLDLFSSKVSNGDTVSLYYVGTLEDGTVFDTNIKSVADAIGLTKQAFDPLVVEVGAGQVVPGFNDALVGMKKDEEREVLIPFHLAYGAPKAELVQVVPRVMETQRFVDVSVDDFKQAFGVEPKRGEIYVAPGLGWDVKVVSVGDVVRLENLLKKGDVVKLQGGTWDSTVLGVSSEVVKIRQDPVVGEGVALPNGMGGRVVEVTDSEFKIDFNHPLVGKNLKFSIKVVDVE